MPNYWSNIDEFDYYRYIACDRCKIGDEVVIIDENYESPVSLVRQAERAQTIPYDMLVHMNKEMFRKIQQ